MNRSARRRALVTGGAGFIGSHLARALLAEGWSVDVADDLSTGDAANVPAEALLIETDLGSAVVGDVLSARYDAICHLAGQSSGEKSFDDPLRDHDGNARSTVGLAHYAQAGGAPVLLHASSMSVYGNVEPGPVREDSPCAPVSWYGASKLAAERALAVTQDVRSVSFRMFSVYGPGQDLTERRQGMVSIFLAMALAGEPVVVRGSVSRVRDFIFVDDCVEAWLRALETSTAFGPINLGTGVGTSIKQMLAVLLEELGSPDHPVHPSDTRTPGDQDGLWADTARAGRELGWEAGTPLRQGFRAMLRSIRGD